MKKISEQQTQQYHSIIQNKFSDIFFQKNDELHSSKQETQISSFKALTNLRFFYVTEPHRQEIFFTEYPMQKRGKKFGTSQMRLLKCVRQTQKLYQVDKNRQAKHIPYPSSFKIQTRQSLRELSQVEWNPKLQSSKYRIKLIFQQRGQIFVYFELQENCMQISAFLSYLIHKSISKPNPFEVFSRKLEECVMDGFCDKLMRYRKQVEKRKELRRRLKGVRRIESMMRDKMFIMDFMQRWRAGVMKIGENEGMRQVCVRVQLKKVYSTERFQSNTVSLVFRAKGQVVEQLRLHIQGKQSIGQNLTERYFTYKNQNPSCSNSYLTIGLKDRIEVSLLEQECQGIEQNQLKQSGRTKNIIQRNRSVFSIFQLNYLGNNSLTPFGQVNTFSNQNNRSEKMIMIKLHPIRAVQKQQHRYEQEDFKLITQTGPQKISQKGILSSSQLKEDQLKIVQKEEVLIAIVAISHKGNNEKNLNQQSIYSSQKITLPSLEHQSRVKTENQDAVFEQQQIKQTQQEGHQQNDSDSTTFNLCNNSFPKSSGSLHIQFHHYLPFIQNQTSSSQALNQDFPMSPLELNYHNPLTPISLSMTQSNLSTLEDYSQFYRKYVSSSYLTPVSFNCVQKLLSSLKVNQLIEKFLLSQTFKPYHNSQYKATHIYKFLVEKSENINYYDVEKLILQYNDSNMRRLLNVIKTFDENPRINFTEPIYLLSQRILQIVRNQFFNKTEQKNQGNFQNSIIGVQSCAFFIVLALLKQFSSIFIYQKQVEKRILHHNTLLFKLVLKKQFPLIWKKCSSLQINIESLFGIQLSSLLSQYFNDAFLVDILCRQVQNKQKDSKLFLEIIAAFLCLLQQVMSLQGQLNTAEGLMIYLGQKSMTLKNPLKFMEDIKKIKHLLQFHNQEEYQALMNELATIYQGSSINYSDKLTFGALSFAVYEQFRHYRPKVPLHGDMKSIQDKQKDDSLRKIFLSIEKLHFNSKLNVRKMVFQVHQGKELLYSHQFKQIDLQTFTLSVELIPVNTQNIVFYIKTKHRSYYYTLDYEKTASNYYHHLIAPLRSSLKHQSVNQDDFICFQVFIKDQTPIEHFENVIPQKYCQGILYEAGIKDKLLEAGKYLRNFRMKEDNFNLLYAKLGWYGNHYLIPEDRLLNVTFFNSMKHLTTPSVYQKQLESIYSALQYTRTIFGKGIISKPKGLDYQLALVDILKNNIRTIQNINSHQTSKSQNYTQKQHKSTQNILTYTLQNFDMDSISSYFQFYHKMCQLPLIDYLTYDTMSFYTMPSIEFNCNYINQIQGVKLTLKVCLSDSPEERKEGEPWRKLVTQFSLDELNLLEKEFIELQSHFFSKGHHPLTKEQPHIQLNPRVNRFVFQPLDCDNKLKQFYLKFPKTLNFSHFDKNVLVDVFGVVIKYNILLSIVKKFYKSQKSSYNSLRESLRLRPKKEYESYRQPQIVPAYKYRMKLLQDNQQIPNVAYYFLFRYMVETSRQLHVSIQLRKERISPIKQTSTDHLSSQQTSSQSTLMELPVTLTNKDKLIKSRTRNYQNNHLKKFQNLGLIHGRFRKVEVLSMQTQLNHSFNQSSSYFNTSQSRTQTVIKPEQQPSLIEKLKTQPISQIFIVEEIHTRKIFKLKKNNIIWKNNSQMNKFQNN